MSTDAAPSPEPEVEQQHAGRLIARRLKANGVDTLFTLSGGHLFSVYDGCRTEGVRLIDTRHEQTAAFAAEGWSKVTRTPGVCALTAGPGVTNGMSAMGSAQQNGSPLVVLGGRAPAFRWGMGSLQEMDHVPFVRPLTRYAETAGSPAEAPQLVDDAIAAATGSISGAAFVDFPLDHAFSEGPSTAADAAPAFAGPGAMGNGPEPDGDAMDRAAALLASAERPVIMAGTNVWWGHGEEALLVLAEQRRIPVFMNGMARGVVPADHELAFSRTRGKALKEADVALVIGVPMDFRLGFGGAFGEETEIIAIDRAEPEREHPRPVAAGLYGGLKGILDALRTGAVGDDVRDGREAWLQDLRTVEEEGRAGEGALLADDRAPLHPQRIYGDLRGMLDRDAFVVVDGGDFGSYAGRAIESYVPGAWLDPGPFGCLGSGPGYALAAKLAFPERQVLLLQGDGAFGFSGMEYDTLSRHGVNVVSVIGNNGIWGLEKHPMEAIYGYSVVADLVPETRYDTVAQALGAHGELVSEPGQLRGALERSFEGDGPAVVNVLTDPTVAYPRKANLA